MKNTALLLYTKITNPLHILPLSNKFLLKWNKLVKFADKYFLMTKSKQLVIELLDNQSKDIFKLTFDLLLENNITQRWVKKVKAAQRLCYKIDDRERFYGFDNIEDETKKALKLINQDIDIINSYKPIFVPCRVHKK